MPDGHTRIGLCTPVDRPFSGGSLIRAGARRISVVDFVGHLCQQDIVEMVDRSAAAPQVAQEVTCRGWRAGIQRGTGASGGTGSGSPHHRDRAHQGYRVGSRCTLTARCPEDGEALGPLADQRKGRCCGAIPPTAEGRPLQGDHAPREPGPRPPGERYDGRRERFAADNDARYQSMIAAVRSSAQLAETARQGSASLGATPRPPPSSRTWPASWTSSARESPAPPPEQACKTLSTKSATMSDGTPATGTDRVETAVSPTGASETRPSRLDHPRQVPLSAQAGGTRHTARRHLEGPRVRARAARDAAGPKR